MIHVNNIHDTKCEITQIKYMIDGQVVTWLFVPEIGETKWKSETNNNYLHVAYRSTKKHHCTINHLIFKQGTEIEKT